MTTANLVQCKDCKAWITSEEAYQGPRCCACADCHKFDNSNLVLAEVCQQVRKSWINNYGKDSLSGNCYELCKRLHQRLVKRDLEPKIISGWVHVYDPELVFTQVWRHNWIVCNNMILDPANPGWTVLCYAPTCELRIDINKEITND